MRWHSDGAFLWCMKFILCLFLPMCYTIYYFLCFAGLRDRLVRMLLEGKGTTEFDDVPGIVFVDRNLVAELHEVRAVRRLRGALLCTILVFSVCVSGCIYGHSV